MLESGRDSRHTPPRRGTGHAKGGSQELAAFSVGSSKADLRQELKEKQLIWEMKEILEASGEMRQEKRSKKAWYQAG